MNAIPPVGHLNEDEARQSTGMGDAVAGILGQRGSSTPPNVHDTRVVQEGTLGLEEIIQLLDDVSDSMIGMGHPKHLEAETAKPYLTIVVQRLNALKDKLMKIRRDEGIAIGLAILSDINSLLTGIDARDWESCGSFANNISKFADGFISALTIINHRVNQLDTE